VGSQVIAARRRHRPATSLAVLLVVLGALWVGAGPASAHGGLVESDPDDGSVVARAPSRVTLTFDGRVQLTAREVVVSDSGGLPVGSSTSTDGPEVVVTLTDPAALADGTYTVAWSVLSDDGHPQSGALRFSIGFASPTVTPPPTPGASSRLVTSTRDVVTALSLLGLLVAAGLALFTALVLPASWPGTDVRVRVRQLTTYAAGLGAAGVVLQVPIASVYAQEQELSSLASGFAAWLVGKEMLAAAVTVAGLGVIVTAATEGPPTRARSRWLAGGALLALCGPPLVGHSRSAVPTSLLLAADALHLAAGAIWIGGLLGLALALRALSGREVLAARTLARFSSLAGGVLVVVATTGAFQAWRIVGSWSSLVGTTYGWLLLTKVALVLGVAGLGAWNRWRLLPDVVSAAGFGDRRRAATAVTRTVRVEALVLGLAIGVTGFLVGQAPG
jgi:copper transport protein